MKKKEKKSRNFEKGKINKSTNYKRYVNDEKEKESLNKGTIIGNKIFISDNLFKVMDKSEYIIENKDIIEDKEESFTEEKKEIKEESSKEEDSGILSMKEVQDIICYHNMRHISKEDSYLFYPYDYDLYSDNEKAHIMSIFFNYNNIAKANYRKIK